MFQFFVSRAYSTSRRRSKIAQWHHLAASFETIAALQQSSGRIEKTQILSSTFQDILKTDVHSFSPALRLTLGYFHGKNTLGVGASALRNSAAKALSIDSSLVATQETELGDLADAVTSLCTRRDSVDPVEPVVNDAPPLSICDITNGLTEMSLINGTDSNTARESLIADLLQRCRSESEIKYLIRTLQGQNKLRIGMGESSIVGAAARAALCSIEEATENSGQPPHQRANIRAVETLGRRMYFARHDLETFAGTLVNGYLLRLESGAANAMELCETQTDPLPLVPTRSMLASPGKSAHEAVQFFVRGQTDGTRDIVCQHKYDGERAQIHVVIEQNKMETRVYSRVGEDNSLRYKHVAERVGELLQRTPTHPTADKNISSCILDGEIVAIDRSSNRLLPFQSLTRRMRDGSDTMSSTTSTSTSTSTTATPGSTNTNQLDSTIQNNNLQEKSETQSQPCDVCFYAFDLLEYNGQSLVHQSLRERRALLTQMIQPVQGELQVCTELQLQVGSNNLDAPTHIHAALEDAVKSGCEGLVVKALDGEGSWYRCGERTKNWLKLKKDYVHSVDGALDTFDLVLLAAYHGKGKRQGLYGSFLMGCLNENDEGLGNGYRTVCKVGTGFSDDALQEIHARLLKVQTMGKVDALHVTPHTHSKIRPAPDVWFEPTMVWEVRAADISLSKVHNSCNDQLVHLGHAQGHGLALRFPRFLRFRDDKNIPDATTESQMLTMFHQQLNTKTGSAEQ